tara:strand:+ start:989 stop:1405 length:417 start_codon:yes stop_codon:yes gene_type:complete
MKISLVPTEHIEFIWSKVQSYMERAAKYTYGRYTAEDIKSELLTKDQQLWIAFEEDDIYGAYVTEIVQYPRLKTCVIHFLGGKQFKKWGWLGLEILQKFAREHKCDVMESYGRPGWEKIWKNDGYKERFIFYELPVEK